MQGTIALLLGSLALWLGAPDWTIYGEPQKGDTCSEASKAWMPTAAELQAACPFEPRFKGPVEEMGGEDSCHYDFGQPGFAGLDVTKVPDSSAAAAAKDAVSSYAALPGYSGEARQMPWTGVEVHKFTILNKGSAIASGYYAQTKKGVFKVEFWTSDRTKTDSCAEKVLRNVLDRLSR